MCIDPLGLFVNEYTVAIVIKTNTNVENYKVNYTPIKSILVLCSLKKKKQVWMVNAKWKTLHHYKSLCEQIKSPFRRMS